MNNNITDSLTQAATLTFEELGFLFPTLETEPLTLVSNFNNTVIVNFHGDGHGKVVLNVSRELLPVIAENILGDDEISEELQFDALGEVANVICGNVLPMIFGKTSIIRLDAPAHGEFSSSHESAAEIRLEFDEGCADVLLYLEKGK
ncbi:MAG: chemotaxis protein CheX [Blastocatellia bacterium]|nr:chemotaxis protein CheX [Blastocatellia bacterium]